MKSPEYRANALSHVKQFYLWAVLEGLIAVDPTVGLVRPRLPRRLPRPIGDEQLVVALDNAPERVRPWLYLAAFAGLRACEISALRREDVLDGADPPVIVISNGKGGKQRVLPLAPQVADALTAYGMPWRGPAFPRRDGLSGPTPPHIVSRVSKLHLHSVGIAHTLHTLRHWFGTSLYRQTHDLRLAQEVMGHASPITTAGYAAWSPVEAAAAVSQLRAPGLPAPA